MNAMQRRLGGNRWLRSHRLVYRIAAGGTVQDLWLVTKGITRPAL